MKNRVFIICILISFYSCRSQVYQRNDLSFIFDKYQKEGAFFLYDLQNQQYHCNQPQRLNEGYLPASTFKIMNSLIGLESGVLNNKMEEFIWDGKQYPFQSWNTNHHLTSAFQNSVVWFYQELARRIGQSNMLKYLNEADYGNQNLSAGIDIFWLEGGFRVTPHEQIQLMVRLYQEALPFQKEHQKIVKKIMLQERTEDYSLYAKTGFVFREEIKYGWWIGFIEQTHNTWFFVMLVDDQVNDREGKIRLTKEILRYLHVYPGPLTAKNNF
ncbi:MAG: class D beta-lactamase [Spirochaetes bacterium]|nr:class D beta-lactamase [Spirochaetota bacterium]